VKRPSRPLEVTQLKQTLRELKLSKLFLIPWNVMEDSYVKDMSTGVREAEFRGTIRGRPELWTIEMVAKAFDCPMEGETHISQRKNFNEPYFTGVKDPKHGWKLKQCNNPELKIFLEFIVPILHPRSHTYCTSSMANLLILAWTGMMGINWAYLLWEVIQDLAKAVRPGKKTKLPSYLAQLYRYEKCLTGDERVSRERLLVHLRTEGDDLYSRDESIRDQPLNQREVTPPRVENEEEDDVPLSQRFPRFTPTKSPSTHFQVPSPVPDISGALPEPSTQSTPEVPEQTIFQQLTQSYDYDTLASGRPFAPPQEPLFPAESSRAESSRRQSSFSPEESQYSPTSDVDPYRYTPPDTNTQHYTHPPVIPSDMQILQQGNSEEDIDIEDSASVDEYGTHDRGFPEEEEAEQRRPEERRKKLHDKPRDEELLRTPDLETSISRDPESSSPPDLKIPISPLHQMEEPYDSGIMISGIHIS